MTGKTKHHLHSMTRRGAHSMLLAGSVLLLGTIGFHFLERFSLLDAFYFSSMLATGQGPAPGVELQTPAGKLFACFYAYISVGSLIASLGYLFGPFMGRLWHLGAIKLEEEIHHKK